MAILVLVIVQIIFGLNFVASKIIVEYLNPAYWAFIRFFISGVILFAIGVILKSGKVKIPRNGEYWIKIIVLSFLGITIGQLTFLKGIKLTTPTNASILMSLIPIFTSVIVLLLKHEDFLWRKVLGPCVALGGVFLLRSPSEMNFSNMHFVGDMLILLGAICSALYISFVRKFLRENDHYWASTWIFILGSLQIVLFSFFEWGEFIWPEVPQAKYSVYMGSLVFSLMGGTLLSYYLSNWALTRISSARASFFIYLQPVITAIFSWTILGEKVAMRSAISCSIIIVGFIIGISKSKELTKGNSN
jgi:drug/metabolite transporter (DMT)-like permease